MTEKETMARQRTTQFVATISWDEDSHFADVRLISQLMEETGDSTRMAADNSHLMVFEDDRRIRGPNAARKHRDSSSTSRRGIVCERHATLSAHTVLHVRSKLTWAMRRRDCDD